MSVINTMLKDLQKREDNFAENNAILSGLKSRSQQAPTTGYGNSLLLISGLGMGLIIALLAAIYFISPYQLVNTASQPTPADNAAATIDPPTIQAPATHTSLADLQDLQPSTLQTTTEKSVTEISHRVTSPPIIAPEKEQAITIEPLPAPKIAKATVAANNQIPSAANAITSNNDAGAEIKSSLSKTPITLSDEENSQQAYSAALNQYNQGQQQAAKDLLKDALVYYPKNKQARQLLAAIHIFEQRPDIAATVMEQGLAINSHDMDLLRVYLQALVQLENYPKAISVMETHFQLTAPDDMAYLAGLYQKDKQHMHAVKYFSQALRLIPANSIWWMGQGISLEAVGQIQQALNSYQQAISTERLTTQLSEFVLQRINSIQTQTRPTP